MKTTTTILALTAAAVCWGVFHRQNGTPAHAAASTGISTSPAPKHQAASSPAVIGPAKTQIQKTEKPGANRTQGLSEAEILNLSRLEELLSQEDGSADKALAPFRAWAAKEPAAAAAWADAHMEGPARRRAVEEAIALMAAHSPQEALAWLDGQPTYEGFEEAYAAAFSALANADAPAAADSLLRHPDLASRENWEMILSLWAAQDAASAETWMRAHLEPEMQNVLLPALRTNADLPPPAAADQIVF